MKFRFFTCYYLVNIGIWINKCHFYFLFFWIKCPLSWNVGVIIPKTCVDYTLPNLLPRCNPENLQKQGEQKLIYVSIVQILQLLYKHVVDFSNLKLDVQSTQRRFCVFHFTTTDKIYLGQTIAWDRVHSPFAPYKYIMGDGKSIVPQ